MKDRSDYKVVCGMVKDGHSIKVGKAIINRSTIECGVCGIKMKCTNRRLMRLKLGYSEDVGIYMTGGHRFYI